MAFNGAAPLPGALAISTDRRTAIDFHMAQRDNREHAEKLGNADMIDIAAMQTDRGLVKTSAGHIHYRAAGSGEAILLFHINQQSSAVYLELMAALSGRFRAIAIDYPSYGMSDHIAFQPTIEDYARWMVEIMDRLGIARAHVLGEATGAAVCIELASAFADRIGKVILVNCPIYLDEGAAERTHAPLKSGLRPTDASGFPLTRTLEFMLEQDPGHTPMHPTQSWMDRINVAQMETGRDRWQALDALHEYDIAGKLKRITQPTLLLIGERFHYVHLKHEFTSRVPGMRCEVLPGGRFGMAWEKAEDIGRMAIDFIDRR